MIRGNFGFKPKISGATVRLPVSFASFFPPASHGSAENQAGKQSERCSDAFEECCEGFSLHGCTRTMLGNERARF